MSRRMMLPIGLVLVALAAVAVWAVGSGAVPLGAGSNYEQNARGIAVDAATTWGALDIDQRGTGDIAVFRDGGTAQVTIADGGATTFDGAVQFNGSVTGGAVTNDLNGGPFYIDPNQSTILRGQTNGLSTWTLPATGTLQVTTGNLRVGNGSNGTTLNGEDAYVEGTFEVDGAINLGGHTTFMDDLQVGNGTPNVTQNGEDAYVEGTSEFDGAMRIDGAVDLNGVVSNAANLSHFLMPAVATASITTTTNGAIWTIPDGEAWVIHTVACQVTTNFDCTGDDCRLRIGDDSDDDALMERVDAQLQTTYNVMAKALGWGLLNGAAAGASTSFDGYMYAPVGSAETIDVDLRDVSSAGNPTAGAATCYLLYTRIK